MTVGGGVALGLSKEGGLGDCGDAQRGLALMLGKAGVGGDLLTRIRAVDLLK